MMWYSQIRGLAKPRTAGVGWMCRSWVKREAYVDQRARERVFVFGGEVVAIAIRGGELGFHSNTSRTGMCFELALGTSHER